MPARKRRLRRHPGFVHAIADSRAAGAVLRRSPHTRQGWSPARVSHDWLSSRAAIRKHSHLARGFDCRTNRVHDNRRLLNGDSVTGPLGGDLTGPVGKTHLIALETVQDVRHLGTTPTPRGYHYQRNIENPPRRLDLACALLAGCELVGSCTKRTGAKASGPRESLH